MDDETAAKYVLFDFELITLIALAVGLLAYGMTRRVRRHRSGLEEEGRVFDAFDVVLMFFPAMMFLINPIAEALVAAKGKGEAEPAETLVSKMDSSALTLLMNIGYFAFVGIMTFGLIEWVRDRRVTELFGLKRMRAANVIVVSILAGVTSLLLCGWLVGDFSNRYLEGLFGELDVQEPVKLLQESSSTLQFVLTVFLACVAAPLVEELLFRGYLYGTVKSLTHPVFAAVVVGGLFAVVHGNLPALLPLWVFSILLTIAYEATRCLWVPIGMHAFFNAANIVLMMSGTVD